MTMADIVWYILLFASVFTELHGGSLQDKRIKQLQMKVRKIHRLLKGVEDGEFGCNDTMYMVSGKLDGVTKLVDNLYQGPLLARMDLTLGYENNYDQVLLKLPDAMEICLKSFEGTQLSERQAEITCLQQILWRYEEPQKERKLKRLQRLIRKYSTNITDITLPPERRIRKEYRTLTNDERTTFHNALQDAYNSGAMADFVELHSLAKDGAHGGAAFLPWHRVFITSFENVLRQYYPNVTLPYWDSTIDSAMSNPINSIMWTSKYAGNGAGPVLIGPFQQWTTHQGFLERAYGQVSRLIRKVDVDNMMTKCLFRDIVVPTGQNAFKLEQYHNNVHRWVGGDMSGTGTSPYDPVFYLHHCYVDYLWEKFRERQRSPECGVNPETDYPYEVVQEYHGFLEPLLEMEHYSVADGMSDSWTKRVYRYEDTPTCENNCGGSEDLLCDEFQNYCVPKSRFSGPSDIKNVPIPGLATTTTDPSLIFASTTHCDHYLDPDCHHQHSMLTLESGEQLQPAEELQIIEEIVPLPKGPLFIGDPGDGRDLRTLREDIENYEEERRGYKPPR